MTLKDKIDLKKLPNHVAIIMDGNGRWAKQQGGQRIFGHQNGVVAVRETVEAAAELGIRYLTLYAFSTENWNRPKLEVDALMSLLVSTLEQEVGTLLKNNVRLVALGDIDSLPEEVAKKLEKTIALTTQNTGLSLVLALSYSGRWEITSAARKLAQLVQSGKITPQQVDESLMASLMPSAFMPDPELLIRTSGESRVSNFLLWQIAYTEFCFTNILWPDFRREHFYQMILDYQGRERRFGKTSEQVIE